jgi:hypothetical protein
MKYYFLAFVMSVLISTAATAQHHHPNIGIKGGLNLYNLDGNGKSNVKSGLHLGLLSHIHLTNQFAFQPEILYSMQGTKYDGSDNSLNLDYINIPLLFQYMFDNGFRIQAGPQVGFLVNAKAKTGNTTVNVKDGYNSLDLGLSIGGSYVYPGTGFGIDARYNHGLSNIYESSTFNATNRGVQLGVFYLFGHK